jgi:phosphoribosylformylglycinamidine (FGAM) synthase PurS component
MHGTYLIEVANKRGVKDTLAAEITEELKNLGAKLRGGIATSKLYRLIGELTAEQRARIGSELLSDAVTEEAHDGGWKPKETVGNRKSSTAKNVIVDVWYKQGVTDAVGESVLKGLRDMDLNKIEDVRTGIRYRFVGLKDRKVAEKLALQLLLNPLIHDRIIHVD